MWRAALDYRRKLADDLVKFDDNVPAIRAYLSTQTLIWIARYDRQADLVDADLLNEADLTETLAIINEIARARCWLEAHAC